MEREGFETKEGLIAIGGLVGAVVVGLVAIGKRFPLSVLFITLMGLFFGIYGKKLCLTCKKSCPCNPDLYFWKRAFRKDTGEASTEEL